MKGLVMSGLGDLLDEDDDFVDYEIEEDTAISKSPLKTEKVVVSPQKKRTTATTEKSDNTR